MANNRYLARFLRKNKNNNNDNDDTSLSLPSDNNDDTSLSLTSDILRDSLYGNLRPKLLPQDLSRLAQTCKRLNGLFQQPLNNAKALRLLEHVAQGDADKVKAMLDTNPALLYLAGEVVDKSGRRIYGTAFQIALGADDTDMWKMIEPYFKKIQDGDEEKAKQFNKQFPASYDEDAHEKYNFSALVDVIAADTLINDEDEMGEATKKDLQAFRDHFTPKSTDAIKADKHFDMQIFIDALAAYDANFDRFRNWEQRSLYCRQVIGYLQRLFPACYAQAFCQGLYNVVVEKKPLVRMLQLVDGLDFFSSGLGLSHFVYGTGMVGRGCRCVGSRVVRWDAIPLKSYVEQKRQIWLDLCGACKTRKHLPIV